MSNKLKKENPTKAEAEISQKGEAAMAKLHGFLTKRLESTSDREHKSVTQKNNITAAIIEIIFIAYTATQKQDIAGMQASQITTALMLSCIILSIWSIISCVLQIKKEYRKKTNIVLIVIHGIILLACLIVWLFAISN